MQQHIYFLIKMAVIEEPRHIIYKWMHHILTLMDTYIYLITDNVKKE